MPPLRSRSTILSKFRIRLTRTDGPTLTVDYATYVIASDWLVRNGHDPLPLDETLSRVEQDQTRAIAREIENLCVRVKESAECSDCLAGLPNDDPLLDLLDFLMACRDGFRVRALAFGEG